MVVCYDSLNSVEDVHSARKTHASCECITYIDLKCLTYVTLYKPPPNIHEDTIHIHPVYFRELKTFWSNLLENKEFKISGSIDKNLTI